MSILQLLNNKHLEIMKRSSIAFLLACTLIYAYPVKAQQNVVKMNFLSLIVKTFNVSYERVIDENNSFQLGVFYTGAKIGDTKLTGFGITPEYRFYLSETEAPNGVYVAPYLRYNNLELKDELSTSEATLSSIGGGLIIGKHWIFKEKVSFDLFIGPSYVSASIKVKSGTTTYDTGAFDGFGLRFGITLGLGF